MEYLLLYVFLLIYGLTGFSASTKEHYGLYFYGLELIKGLIHVEEKKEFHLWNQFSWECLRIIFVISSGTKWKKNKELLFKFLRNYKDYPAETYFPTR